LNAELEDRVARRTAELHTAQRFLDSILENIPDAIVVKDGRDALRYVRINRACEQLMDLPRDEWIGRTDAEMLPEARARALNVADRDALTRGGASTEGCEETINTLRQGQRIVLTKKIVMPDDDGGPRYLIGISHDITNRKLAEDALRQARLAAECANRAKSEFLSRMSHDLRTPLNAILGFAQLLEFDTLTAEQLECVTRIRRGGHHLLALINEVLDIARIEAGHLSLSLEPVSPLEVVQQALELVQPLAASRNITLAVHPSSADAAVVLADRERLSQVLLNLLSNAVKYNRPGGQVTVGFDRVEGRRLRLGVSDTGGGIPPAKLALLFRPFERLGAEQSEVEGTGLGLVLSRALAEAMGGTLGVTSEVDRGSTFWIELVLSDASPSRIESLLDRVADLPADPETKGLILYIEDNGSNVRLMERVLQRRPGVRLLHAPRGTDGLRLARETRPSLIFLDLHLPDMSGEDVLRELYQDRDIRGIPVAVLSADAAPARSRRLQASGAIAYLTKPLEIRQVLRLVDEVLANGGQAIEARA
jgi:PAS domain S-box-containing protein